MATTKSPYVPEISLKDYDDRKDEIMNQLMEASETSGFFTLVDHGISVEEIEEQFAIAQVFFALPAETKELIPHDVSTNNGYENKSQIRPSTNQADQKESFWLHRTSEWPADEHVPGFRETTQRFIDKCDKISHQVLTCFAIALGLEEDYFRKAMDASHPDCLTQLRMLHYPPSDDAKGTWRAGSHTDIGCLTLLFQRDGEDGLEICPGRETYTSFAMGDKFFPLPAKTGPIVVNIGDMLMAWSDDRLKANFHRVRAKDVGHSPDRYSIAYFNTGRKDYVMQGPLKKYPAITCEEYFLQHTERQFGHNRKRQEDAKQRKATQLSQAQPVAVTA
ncbi:Oxoglutarate/iron-dependent dioxygenase [Pleurostoma richardsiae]|uniref:Oxoglutarate/iron-dependent dioxygenase n=1 Tax=Pleurostoma richardsiae TaxID=41990 RepID=A0AA38S6T4_9PEZI|nr:Oxoglutarate/iron-dependent dioxygenase [Pleurostoma richardsiae]